MKKRGFVLLILIVLSIVAVLYTTNLSKAEETQPVSNQIIVKFKQNPEIKENGLLSTFLLRKPKIETSFDSVNNLNKQYNVKEFNKIIERPEEYIYTFSLDTEEELSAASEKYESIADIEIADATTTNIYEEGEIETVILDYEEEHRSETKYFLRTKNKETKQIFFDNEIPLLQSGTKVKVFGRPTKPEVEKSLFESDLGIFAGNFGDVSLESPNLADEDLDLSPSSEQGQPASIFLEEVADVPVDRNLGEQKTALVRVKFLDDQTDFMSEAQAQTLMTTVNQYYLENSYGQTSINADVLGYYTVPINKACSYDYIRDYILNDLTISQGVDWTRYSRLLIAWKSNLCSWSGLGQISGSYKQTSDGIVWMSYAFLDGADGWDVGTTAHELGHNLGVGHANDLECSGNKVGSLSTGLYGCTSISYGDIYDIMGYSSSVAHMGSYHKEQIGWFNSNDILQIDGTNYGTYKIGPIETSNPYYKGIRIQRLNYIGQPISYTGNYCTILNLDCKVDYYLEYKQPIGFDSSINPGILNGVIIRLDHYFGGGDTQLIDNTPHTIGQEADSADIVLRQGESFVDINSNLYIEVISITEDYAEVEIKEEIPSVYAEISSPVEGDYLINDLISIKGTVFGGNYDLSYKSESDNSWSSFATGSGNIVNDVLGVLDSSALSGGWYDVKVEVSKEGTYEQADVRFYLDKFIQEGWPQPMGGWGMDPSLFYDIDYDGDMEIFTPASQNPLSTPSLFGWHHDGTPIDGWPKRYYVASGTFVCAYPSLGDVDGDNEIEVVVWCGKYGPTGNDYIGVYDTHGNFEMGPKEIAGLLPFSVLADMDNDGTLDIVVVEKHDENGVKKYDISVWKSDGSKINSWRIDGVSNMQVPPAIGDIDGDSDNEIVVTSAYKIVAYHHDGTIVNGWENKVTGGGYYHVSPVIADLDKDGQKEVVVVNGGEIEILNSNGLVLHSAVVGSFSYGEFGLGDVIGDDSLEIFLRAHNSCLNNCNDKVYGIDRGGNLLAGWPVSQTGDYFFGSGPIIGDIDGDGKNEILSSTATNVGFDYNRIFAWEGDGSLVEGFPLVAGGPIFGTLAIADTDNDGDIELMSGTLDMNFYVWDLGAVYTNVEWPMERYDAQNTGCYKCETSTHTICSNNQCIEVQGAGTNECTTNLDCQPQPSCTDTSSGPLDKGKVYGTYQDGTTFNYEDSCDNENTVREWMCGVYTNGILDPNKPQSVTGSCSSFGENYACQNGACVFKQTATCTDTDMTPEYPDGKNYLKKGTITETAPGGGIFQSTDGCVPSSSKLFEWYCDNTESVFVSKECLDFGNYICQDGACVINQPQEWCEDSDGEDAYTFGYCDDSQGNHFEDGCYALGAVREVGCIGNTCSSSINAILCDSGYNCVNGVCVINPATGNTIQESPQTSSLLTKIKNFFSNIL